MDLKKLFGELDRDEMGASDEAANDIIFADPDPFGSDSAIDRILGDEP